MEIMHWIIQSKISRTIIKRVDKVIESYSARGRSQVLRSNQQLFTYKNEDNAKLNIEFTNTDINKQFNADRQLVAKSIKKRALLSRLTANFQTALLKNFERQKDFKCYEKPKRIYMSEYHKQCEMINKIGTCELNSGSAYFSC